MRRFLLRGDEQAIKIACGENRSPIEHFYEQSEIKNPIGVLTL